LDTVVREIGRFIGELLGVFLAGVIGFIAMLLVAAGMVVAWLIGCASSLFLIIGLAESAWWLHSHSRHAAVTALAFCGYAAATFALIPVLFWLRDKLIDWPDRRRRAVTVKNLGRARVAKTDAPFIPARSAYPAARFAEMAPKSQLVSAALLGYAVSREGPYGSGSPSVAGNVVTLTAGSPDRAAPTAGHIVVSNVR
jgi:hypothetical protein